MTRPNPNIGTYRMGMDSGIPHHDGFNEAPPANQPDFTVNGRDIPLRTGRPHREHRALFWYPRLYGLFARQCLMREMMFRGDFLMRCITHMIWLSVMLFFLNVIFRHTQRIGDWNQNQLMTFVGTFMTVNAAVNCLFINGCSRFSELVRSGSLDFELLKPVDEQFLLTCQRIDWALLPQVLLGLALSGYAALRSEIAVSPTRVAVYFMLLVAGMAILYGLLVILSACSVWTVRHDEVYELWFCLLQFSNYPDDIYRKNTAGLLLRTLLTYLLPILLAVNVPARYGAMLLSGWQPVASLAFAAILALLGSRHFFKFALKSYQSASS